MKSNIIKHTVSLLLSVAFSLPVAASQYGDMKQKSGTYVPAFYLQSFNEARNDNQFSSFSPGVENATMSYSEAIQNISDMSEKKVPVNIDGLLQRFLATETLDEYNRINKLLEKDNTDAILPDTVKLNNLLASAIAFSPSIKAAEDNLKAAFNRYGQAVFLDQILFQYLSFTESLNTKTSSMKNQQMVQMNFPFPGMVALKGKAVDKDVEIARVEYEKAVRDVLSEVKIKYADVQYFNATLDITRQNLKIARDIEKVVMRLYETGTAEYSSVVKISIRVDKLGTMENTFSRKKDAAITALRKTIGFPEYVKTTGFEETSFTDIPELGTIRKQALSQFQELRSMQLMIERMDIMIEMGGRKLFPDYSLGFSYFQNREVLSLGTQGKAATFMTRSMGPGAMPDFANENAYLSELKDKREAMVQKLEDMRNRTYSMVEMYFANYSSSRNTSETYETSIIKKAHNAYEATLGAYTSGSGSFIDLLDAHRILLDQELSYEDARLMARTSLAMLEKTAGGRITVEKGVGSK